MPKIHIYGLPPQNLLDTKVVIFDERTFNTSTAKKLFEGTPDANGKVVCDVEKEYIGEIVRLVAMLSAPESFGQRAGTHVDTPPV